MEQTQKPNPEAEHLLSRRRMREIIILSLLVVALYAVFRIVSPYLHAIILATLMAYLFSPVHSRIRRWTSGRKGPRENLAAFATCMVVALVVMLPIAGFTSTLVYRGIDTFNRFQVWVEEAHLEDLSWLHVFNESTEEDETDGGVSTVPDAAGASSAPRTATATEDLPEPDPRVVAKLRGIVESAPVQWMLAWKARLFPDWRFNPEATRDWVLENSGRPLGYLKDKGVQIVGNAFLVAINFVLMLFVMFYFFRDGGKIMDYLVKLSPLDPEQERMLIQRIQAVTKSAVFGTVLTGIAQGALAMIAFAITGIPWLVYGVMLGFASLIPVVGTALVWVPCVIYLLIYGKIGAAIFLALWCIVVVGLVDNLLRPLLMQGKTGMPSLILFFAILGGIQLFGLIGVIYGPLIFGLCAVLLVIFELETGVKPTRDTSSRKRRRRKRKPRADDGGAPAPAE